MVKREWQLLNWQRKKAGRRIKSLVYRRLYRNPNSDISKSVLVAGTARSGTTWLADIVSTQLRGRIMFEPFNPRRVQAYSQFHYFQYMRAAERDEELETFCRQVLSGSIRDSWIDRQVEYLNAEQRVIKAIRANLLLRWIREAFPEVQQVFIIRHPCAVVLSRMALNWDTDKDIEPFLAQPKLVHDFLSDKMEVIEKAISPEEKHAIVWCVSNLVPLKQDSDRKLHIVFYEHLLVQPKIEVPRLFAAITHQYSDATYARLSQPSTTTRPNSAIINDKDKVAQWQNKLSSKQVDRILRVVDAFGMGQMYSDGPLPLPQWRSRLAS